MVRVLQLQPHNSEKRFSYVADTLLWISQKITDLLFPIYLVGKWLGISHEKEHLIHVLQKKLTLLNS